MMRLFAFTCIIFLVSFGLRSQVPELDVDAVRQQRLDRIDSLQKVYNSKLPDTVVIKSLVDEYLLIDADSLALLWVDRLLEAHQSENASEIHHRIANIRILKSDILVRLGKELEAVEVLEKNLIDKHLISKKLLTDTYSELSALYSASFQLEKALEYAFKTEEIYLQTADSVGLSFTYYSIATSYLSLERFEESVAYYEKAYQYCTKKRFRNKAIILINLSLVLSDMKEYSMALQKLQMSDSIVVKNGIVNLIPEIYKLYGILYFNKKEYEKSLSYCRKAIELIEQQTVDKRYISSVNKYTGYNYYAQSKYDQAITHLEIAMDNDVNKVDFYSAKAIENYPLIDAYAKVDRFQEAYDLLLRFANFKDSANAAAQEERVTEIVERYENEKKQNEIEKLQATSNLQNARIEKQTYLILFVLLLALFMGLMAYFLYRSMKAKQALQSTKLELEKSQLQHRFLRTQLNPHFFFHALSSIENYIDRKDSTNASEFLQSFSKLMRQILESSDVDFITLADETNLLHKYLEIQQLNYGFSFDYIITVDQQLAKDRIMIPPMLLQPYVENAIVHGVSTVKEGKVTIDISRAEDQLVIKVTDNGKSSENGHQSAQKLNKSMSMEILNKRIANLREIHQFMVDVSVDLSDTGSQIEMKLPLYYGNFYH
ncbi:MAG: histidine kinase [Bacteroidota bacterium]